MRRRTLYVILGAVAVAAAIVAFVWQPWPTEQAEETLRSAVVERDTMIVAVSASGSIEPKERVRLSFDTIGRVANVFVEEGDSVEAGEALAQLNTSQLELQVEQSKAILSSAQAQLAQLQAGPRPKKIEQAEADLSAAEAQLSAAVARYDQVESGPGNAEIAAAEAQVAQARAQKKQAQIAYDEIEDSGDKKEQANYDLYTAKQNLAAAEAKLDDLLAGADANELRGAQANVWAAAAQRDAAKAQLAQIQAGATKKEIEETEAQVEQARAALKLAELSLEEATLRAPVDGIVSEVNAKADEMPPTTRPSIVLLDNSGFHVTVSVDEMNVAQLAEGQKARVRLDAFPNRPITGTVESIAPIAALNGGVVTYDVTVDLDPTDVPVRADMSSNVTVVVDKLTDVLTIPTWAIRIDRNTGQPYVHRRAGGEIRRVDVELGVRHEGVAQVLEGLAAGDEIVQGEEDTTFDFSPPEED